MITKVLEILKTLHCWFFFFWDFLFCFGSCKNKQQDRKTLVCNWPLNEH